MTPLPATVQRRLPTIALLVIGLLMHAMAWFWYPPTTLITDVPILFLGVVATVGAARRPDRNLLLVAMATALWRPYMTVGSGVQEANPWTAIAFAVGLAVWHWLASSLATGPTYAALSRDAWVFLARRGGIYVAVTAAVAAVVALATSLLSGPGAPWLLFAAVALALTVLGWWRRLLASPSGPYDESESRNA